jgi:hypothetical protein
MAARLNNFHQETVKQKIQASQLVNRLQKHAFGEIEMSATQLDAAKFLLNKRLGNAATEINVGGQEDNPVVGKVVFEVISGSQSKTD